MQRRSKSISPALNLASREFLGHADQETMSRHKLLAFSRHAAKAEIDGDAVVGGRPQE